jgi:hypothetical protein
MTLRTHAAFASACGSKECATRTLSILELRICLPRHTRRRSSGARIFSTIRANHDKACSGIAYAGDFNSVARNVALWTRVKLWPEFAADAE